MFIDFASTDTLQKQQWLHSAEVPRPIGLISTVGCDWMPNLAPFSFFNVVSIDPPILIFSPLRRVHSNTSKHTVENIRKVLEAAIHIMPDSMLHQMNLTACEYLEATDEFIKAGFVRQKASAIKPWLINDCAVIFECRVKEMRPMGNKGGSGTLIFPEVACLHYDSKALDGHGHIVACKLHPVARLGGEYYTTIHSSNLITMFKPSGHLGICFAGLPTSILNSFVLSANDLGQLAMVYSIPGLNENFMHKEVEYTLKQPLTEKRTKEVHVFAKKILSLGLVEEAW